jgi:predicted molibdopterin-dependent oxidoreductase YjgC
MGIFISSMASNEDAYMAAKLAQALGTKNISAAGNLADQEAYQGSRGEAEGSKPAKIEEIEKDEALLIIGDVLTQAPCLSKNINKVKYGKRGNQILVVDPNLTHTSWFATTHLKNKPGTEPLLLAAMIKVLSDKHKKGKLDIDLEKTAKTIGISPEEIVKAAQDFDAAPSGTIIFVPRKENEGNELVGYLIKVLAGLSAGKKFITFFGFGNTLGVNLILDRAVEGHASYAELLKKIESGQIKSLLMLGEDIAASHPELEKKIRNLEFVCMSNYFVTPLVDETLMLLPLASHLESAASYVSGGGRTQKVEPVAPKIGAKSNLEIVAGLLGGAAEVKKASQEAKQMVEKGIPQEKIDLKQKLTEAQKIKARDHLPELNITHFGNNSLAKRFFWYRVNNIIG